MPNAELVRVAGAAHIPRENEPHQVADALSAFRADNPRMAAARHGVLPPVDTAGWER